MRRSAALNGSLAHYPRQRLLGDRVVSRLEAMMGKLHVSALTQPSAREVGRRRSGRRGKARQEMTSLWMDVRHVLAKNDVVLTGLEHVFQDDNCNNHRGAAVDVQERSSSVEDELAQVVQAISRQRRGIKRKKAACGLLDEHRLAQLCGTGRKATLHGQLVPMPERRWRLPLRFASSLQSNTSGVEQPERHEVTPQLKRQNDDRRLGDHTKRLSQEKLDRLSELIEELGIKMDSHCPPPEERDQLRKEQSADAVLDRELQDIVHRKQKILDEVVDVGNSGELFRNKNSAGTKNNVDIGTSSDDSLDYQTYSHICDRGRRRESRSEGSSWLESCSAGEEKYRTLTDQLREIQMHTKHVLQEKEQALEMLAAECEAVGHEPICTREVAAEMGTDLMRIRSDCESLSLERTRLEGKLRMVEDEKLKVLLTLVAARDLVTKLRVENEGLEHELQASVTKNLSQRNAMDELRADLECTRSRLAEQEDEVMKLEMALSEARSASCADQQELQQRVHEASEVQEELHMNQMKCANLTRELKLVRARNDELDRQVNHLRLAVLKMKRLTRPSSHSDHWHGDSERLESPLHRHHVHGGHCGSPRHRYIRDCELSYDDEED